MKKPGLIFPLLAIVCGLLIAWADSRPGWDDSGITAFAVLITAGLISWLYGKKPWLIALAVSICIPIYCIISTHNYSSLVALAPGFIGAFAGYFIRSG